MDDQKQQIIEKLHGAKNVLVTVSSDPSVDQLAACIALTLMLNKLDKHATAVYSGKTPSTIEFLKPEETIEKNTDSLRDFIIALDKSKADKLRYKVEEKVVKIFITPYRTSLNEKDLNFSQGDFNVDVVIGIGVHKQQDLDSAITAHGRILHDAVVATINNTPDGDLGSIHWQDLSTSSLSEQIASMVPELGDNLLDQQIATALLTGIVAETARFSNSKTSPRTMSVSAELMAAGANQQLVATQLEQGGPAPEERNSAAPVATNQDAAADNGELSIQHSDNPLPDTSEPDLELPVPEQPEPEEPASQAPEADSPEQADNSINDLKPLSASSTGPTDHLISTPKLMTEPPVMGGTLTANSKPEELDPSTDPLSLPREEAPLLNRMSSSSNDVSGQDATATPATDGQGGGLLPVNSPTTPEPSDSPLLPSASKDYDHETLTQIEQEVHHDEGLDQQAAAESATAAVEAADDLDSARQAVENAIKSSVDAAPPEPIDALGAQPVDLPGLGGDATPPPAPLSPPTESLAPPPFAPEAAAPFAPAPPLSPLTPVDPLSLGSPDTAAPTPPPPPLQPLPPLGPAPLPPSPANEPAPLAESPADQAFTMPLPPNLNVPPAQSAPPTNPPTDNPLAPPPVPPPMMPPGFGPPPTP